MDNNLAKEIINTLVSFDKGRFSRSDLLAYLQKNSKLSFSEDTYWKTVVYLEVKKHITRHGLNVITVEKDNIPFEPITNSTWKRFVNITNHQVIGGLVLMFIASLLALLFK